MDLANTLIRSVVRAFYETRQILVVDALFRHSVYDPSCLLEFGALASNADSNGFSGQTSCRRSRSLAGYATEGTAKAMRQVTGRPSHRCVGCWSFGCQSVRNNGVNVMKSQPYKK
jgi:hypothetical protein